MTWECFDADRTLYSEAGSTPTTLATANADPVGAWSTIRGANIAGRAYQRLRPYADNMTYAASLLVGDATHNRCVRLSSSSVKEMDPNADFNNPYNRGDTTMLVGMRVRIHSGVTASGWGIWGYDVAGVGPGIGFINSGGRKWACHTTASAMSPSSSAVVEDVWTTVLMRADASGTSLYVDDPDTPVFTSAVMTPAGVTTRSLVLYSLTSVGFDIYRMILGGDIDLTDAPVGDVMSWLEGA